MVFYKEPGRTKEIHDVDDNTSFQRRSSETLEHDVGMGSDDGDYEMDTTLPSPSGPRLVGSLRHRSRCEVGCAGAPGLLLQA